MTASIHVDTAPAPVPMFVTVHERSIRTGSPIAGLAVTSATDVTDRSAYGANVVGRGLVVELFVSPVSGGLGSDNSFSTSAGVGGVWGPPPSYPPGEAEAGGPG